MDYLKRIRDLELRVSVLEGTLTKEEFQEKIKTCAHCEGTGRLASLIKNCFWEINCDKCGGAGVLN